MIRFWMHKDTAEALKAGDFAAVNPATHFSAKNKWRRNGVQVAMMFRHGTLCPVCLGNPEEIDLAGRVIGVCGECNGTGLKSSRRKHEHE